MKYFFLSFFFILGIVITLNAGCELPISEAEFQSELTKVKSFTFDEAKKTAIESLFKKCLTSNQIKCLLQELSFEEDKLALAKKAIKIVFDPENFKIIKPIFEFEESKKAIDTLD